MKPRRPATSFAAQKRAVQSTLAGLETQFGDLREAKGQRELGRQEIAPKRTIVNRTDPAELEASVKTEVSHILAHHPRVLFAVRQNSGAAWMPSKGGKDAPVSFYFIVRQPEDMTIVDFTGFLKPMRPFAIECKRRNWKWTGSEREKEQKAYIDMIKDRGGLGAFVTGGDHLLAILGAP